jgi:hypothetical protein
MLVIAVILFVLLLPAIITFIGTLCGAFTGAIVASAPNPVLGHILAFVFSYATGDAIAILALTLFLGDFAQALLYGQIGGIVLGFLSLFC